MGKMTVAYQEQYGSIGGIQNQPGYASEFANANNNNNYNDAGIPVKMDPSKVPVKQDRQSGRFV